MRRIGRILAGLLSLWALGLGAIAAYDLTRPGTPALPPVADAIICLGADMSYQGWDRPGPASTRRARSCAELYRAGVAPVVVFTGHGHARGSAAAAMARVAMAEGLPERAVILEEAARSTVQNAVFSRALLPPDTDAVVVVTDGFHIPRSWLIFRAFGGAQAQFYPARDLYTSPDRVGIRTRRDWVLRESLAVWGNLARAAIYLGAGALGIDQDTRISWFN